MVESVNLILKNGMILDGSGNPWYQADVAIKGDQIAFIGDCRDFDAERTLECEGLTVCPGFIDTHSHSDLMLLKEPLAAEKVMQGVTTELLGQDGIAVAPVRPEHRDLWRRQLSGLLGDPDFEWDWTDYEEYFQRLKGARPSVNALSLAPHGALRVWAMGMEDRAPTPAELDEMAALLREQMDAGCVGLSTGLIYPPCIYASRDEMVALCSAMGEQGGFLVVHMRSEGYQVEEALEEVIGITSSAGVPLHISHLKVAGRENFGKSGRIL
jgi:N-acyl-D-amino-acid deacylase